jgi:hypothetical protein
MKIGLRMQGKAIGIDPTPKPGAIDDARYPVYSDKDQFGVWEAAELTKHADGRFDVRFLAANRQLSLTPFGLESRVAGTFGPWEMQYATDQPDGSSLLYRFEGQTLVTVLTIEALH